MSKRMLLLTGFVGLLITVLVSADVEAAERPNVLFIAFDDLRPELGCYGAAGMETPNFDRLAKQGLLFERAYCQVAVCNPSRNSVLSGARPATTRIWNNQTFLQQTMPDVVTLPEHFKNHGYTSVSLGKIFHHSEREPGDIAKAWSEPSWYHGTPYRSWFTAESNEFIKRLKALPEKERPKLTRGPPFEAADEPDESYPDAKLATKAIETLGRLKGKPFFLGVGFQKPHLPFTCPRKYWDLYPADADYTAANPEATKDAPAPAFHNGYELRSYGGIPATGELLTPEKAKQLARGYRACVSFVDAQLGRVLDELDRLGLNENTIVVVWGDHGYHLGDNGLWTKMTNFERGTRVPLLVRLPKQATAGGRARGFVELVDLYPTLVELCGLPNPAHLEGTSFVPLLADPTKPWKTAAFSEYLRPGKTPHLGRSIRTETHRYTEWTDPKNKVIGVELYDYQVDPLEKQNRAADPQNNELVAKLAAQLKAGPKAVRNAAKN
jgi:arylsulfatase A-like enzyme